MVRGRLAPYNIDMDRDRLEDWLRSDHRTWRWRFDEDYDRYEAVESSEVGFRFFAWSHVPGEDGVFREARQSFDDFEARGPLWRMPAEVERQIRAWLAGRR